MAAIEVAAGEGTLATGRPAVLGATSGWGHQWLGPPVVGATWPSRLRSLPRCPRGCHGAQHLVQWGTDVEMKSPVPWFSCFSIISCFSLR